MTQNKKELEEKTAFEVRLERLEKHYETTNKKVEELLTLSYKTIGILDGSSLEGSGLLSKVTLLDRKLQDVNNKIFAMEIANEQNKFINKILVFLGSTILIALIAIIFKFIFNR